MKKAIIIITLCVATVSVSAQGLFDVSKYAGTDILGTARYMALAGSMGAIGGDPSAIFDNPGALGIYRSSEVSFTVNATPSVTFASTAGYQSKANDFFFNFNQISYILAIPSGKETGYVSSNFSFSYNRLKDFNRTVYLRDDNTPSMANAMASLTNGFAPSSLGYDNSYAPYLSVLGYEGYIINPGSGADSISYTPHSRMSDKMAYRGIESGRIDEYNISYAANVGHFLYIGAGVGLQTLNYRLVSSSAEYYSDGGSYTLNNSFSATGVGAVLRFGVIARPLPFLRLGFSLQSPVWYSMSDIYSGSSITRNITDRGQIDAKARPGNSYYDFNSPFRFQASVGFVFGKVALLNVDYQYTDNKGMRLIDRSSYNDILAEPAFSFENSDIKDNALTSHLLKVGAEFRIAQQFSFRAGVAYETQNISSDASRYMMDNTTRTDLEMFHDLGSWYASGGFGYRYNGFGIDITYAYNRHNQYFSPYQQNAEVLGNGYFGLPAGAVRPASLSKLHTDRHNVVLTLLYKF